MVLERCRSLNGCLQKTPYDSGQQDIATLTPNPLAIMDSERYQYLPLEHRQIRLLKASCDDSKHSAQLRCDFLVTCLDELEVNYRAISYVWGDLTAVSQITCTDGGYLELTSSAVDILNAMVDNPDTDYLWIDQICINQEDIEEKANQVRMMGDIFASANGVLAWLGPRTEDSDKAIRFIDILCCAFRELETHKVAVTTDSLCQMSDCEHPSPMWTALRNLLKRPWFERLWIVQEIVMCSRKIMLFCGRDIAITWDALAEVVVAIEANGISRLLLQADDDGRGNSNAPHGLLNTACIFALKRMKEKQQPISLQFGLIYCLRFKATDPRDKVWAVLGLASDADDPVLYPNYGEPVCEVFTLSSRHMMTTSSSLRILHFAGIGWSRQIQDLPSWVSDWSAPQRLIIYGDMADNAGYRASASLSSIVRAGPDSKSVTLRTILIDSMHECLPQPDIALSWWLGNADKQNYRQAMVSWISQLRKVVESSPHYARNGSNKDVLWRLLIANTTRPGLLAGPEYCEFFESWLNVHHNSAACSKEAWKFNAAFSDAMGERVMFTTTQGLIGIGPPRIQARDLVCIIIGAQTPFLLRKSTKPPGETPVYQLVGDCYVHGLMNGEGLRMGQEQDVILV